MHAWAKAGFSWIVNDGACGSPMPPLHASPLPSGSAFLARAYTRALCGSACRWYTARVFSRLTARAHDDLSTAVGRNWFQKSDTIDVCRSHAFRIPMFGMEGSRVRLPLKVSRLACCHSQDITPFACLGAPPERLKVFLKIQYTNRQVSFRTRIRI